MKRYLLFAFFIAATIAAHAQLVEDFSPNPTGWILDQGAKFYNLNGNDVVQTPGAGDNTPSIICTPAVNKTSNTVKVCLDIWGYTPTMNAQIAFPCTPTYMDVVFVKSTVATWQDAKDPANVLASIPNYTLPQNGGNMCVTFTFPANVTDNNFKVMLSFHADCNKGGYKYIIDNVSISGVALICGGTNCPPVALNDMFNRTNSNELSFSGALYGSNLSYPSNPTVDPTGTDNDQNDGYADLQWKVLTAPNPAIGSVTVNTDGTFSVTRTSNSITQLTFTYQLTDDGPDNDFTTTGDNMTSNANVTINWVAAGSLPVTLVNFNASRSGSTVNLTWTTNMESNNTGFNIQRSSGNGAFETVGFVATKAPGGISDMPINYQYKDANTATGNTYYRLAQVDKDGKTTLSPVKGVRGLQDNARMTVYPNPAQSGNMNVLFGSSAVRNIVITDLSGRILKQWNDYHNDNMVINGLRTGVYILIVTNKGTSEKLMEKLVVL